MSIIFGIRKPAGAFVSEQELLHLAQPTERYALDGTTLATVGRVGMGFQPHYTHLRSKLELGPASDRHGNMLVFDGRLDNHQELHRQLQLIETPVPDSQIILAAFLHWGEDCFSHFIGDWAIALWSAKNQVLHMARDHAGTRTLYFENRNGTLQWSTYLDSFFADPRSLEVDEDYAACYLSAQPLRDLTPYKGIRGVLPAHYVLAKENTISKTLHWEWMSKETIRYKSCEDYDAHFLSLFAQSVERRDDPGAPIVAQLSGGMDSSAIVCMSDCLRKARTQSVDLIDTISSYDDSEPSWDEKPYFTAVEAKRGKTGVHIDTSFMDRTFALHDPTEGWYFLPGPDSSAIEQERKAQTAMGQNGYRSILSGIGGDELLGGVPSPEPELANYLVAGQFESLLKQAVEWALVDRSPLIQVLYGTAKYTREIYGETHVDKRSMPPWVASRLQKICAGIAQRDVTNRRPQGLTPSAISNGLAWWSVMETLPHAYPGVLSRPEYRYPFLDRQLVEYLFSVPREQLLQPGRRRLLMRRALKGIVPDEILDRRRKAYRVRGPLTALQESRNKVDLLFTNPLIRDKGFIDLATLKGALDLTEKGRDMRWWQAIMRAIAFELWLKGHHAPHALANRTS